MGEPCVAEANVGNYSVSESAAMIFQIEGPPEFRQEHMAKWGLAGAEEGKRYVLRCIGTQDTENSSEVRFAFEPLD